MAIVQPTSIRLTEDDRALLVTVREHMQAKFGVPLTPTDMMRLGLVAIARAEGLPLPQSANK